MSSSDAGHSLRHAASLELFREDPVGHYHGGEGWMHWCWSRELWGVVLWERPGPEETSRLIDSLRLELAPATRAHHSLVDASRLTGADLAAFELLNSYVRDNQQALTDKVTRLALVRPGGMAGAVTAGFYQVLEAPYPVELCDTAEDALAWLERDSSAELVSALVEAQAVLSGGSPLLARLRAQLRADLDTTQKEAARALAVSERTLQRRLGELGTSFRAELLALRLSRAKDMMRDSGAALTQIALDCGFPSLQSFSAAFRKQEGCSPSAWRQRQVGAQS